MDERPTSRVADGPQNAVSLRAGDRVLTLDRTLVMGVVNVTPDSFSDGGLWYEARTALEHGRALVDEGADIVDIGGESTRPGAEAVPEREELRRVLPVVEGLRGVTGAPLSIDTRKASVARAAVEAGASIVNDTRGEGADGTIDEGVAEKDVALVVMHSRGTPATMRALTDYRDVVAEVADWLAGRAEAALARGVAREALVVDPGFGFAKTPAQNVELLRGLDRLVALGYPVLVGTSRKSFIGAILDLPVEQRVEGTAATVAWAVAGGAHIVRVHDVAPIVRVVRMTEAITGAAVPAP
jgi:dihydropteroate synthase